MAHKVDIEVEGRLITLETGRLAKQAGGSVIVSCGDARVLVAATASDEPREGVDFFPLTVDYREYTYSAGRFPGGYIKREGRPSEKEVLTSRMIDRPLRPLFPAGFRNDTQIIAFVISADPEFDPSPLAMIGASAALAISPIPVAHTTGAVRVAHLESGEWSINPTYDELAESDWAIIVAAAEPGIVMVEAGGMEVDEEIVVESIRRGHEACKTIIAGIEKLAKLAGKPKMTFTSPQLDETLLSEVFGKWGKTLEDALDTKKYPKLESYSKVKAIKKEIKAAYADDEAKSKALKPILEQLQEKIFRRWVLEENRRPDGRDWGQIRPIDCTVSELPRTHGSAVFTRGETQALVTVTLGTKMDTQRQELLDDADYQKTFMVHYNFPPFSVGETGFLRGPGRREIGHGMLAERALATMMPAHEDFPYTVRVVSDILESNGSSSMATVCGGSLALMDAGVPVKAPVAGVAMGLVVEGSDYRVLSDIAGAEDHYGDMDFKVAGTSDGVCALQMDIKAPNISLEIMEKALEQARDGRLHILGKMAAALEEPRAEVSQFAPRITTITIPTSKIRDIIGPGGKTIKGIVEATGAQIDVSDDGTVSVASTNGESAKKAIAMIQELTASAEVGKTYLGTVTRIVDFGAFVEIFAGTEGLLHISEIAEHRIRAVKDELKLGDQILVKCLALDGNKIKLSRRAVLQEQKEQREKRKSSRKTSAPAADEAEESDSDE
ncbi:MAG: polyribonucleotide nucleotidyltransferase [Acidobacteria bacterium]|nr:polyribonucleotide nucleotidyltransferase [Acidobacteriota bacterium]